MAALRRVAIVLGVLIALVAFGLFGISRLGWGRDTVRRVIETQAAGALDGTLAIGGVSGSLVGGVELQQVRFIHRGTDVFTARAVEARFSLWQWLRGRHEITAVRVVDPVIALEEHDDEWSVSQWARARSSSGGASQPLQLPSIEIVNGTLRVKAVERVWRLPAEWRALNATARVTVGEATTVDLQALSFATVADAQTPAFDVRRGSGVLTFHQGVHLSKVRVESSAGAIEVNGSVGDQHPRVLTLTAAITAFDTARWKAFTSLFDTVSLTADGTLKFLGPIDRLSIEPALTSTAGGANGTVTVENTRDRLRISGDLVLTAADAARVTADAAWRSDLTGRARFVADHAGTPAAWTARVSLDGGPFRAFGADFTQLHGSLAYAGDAIRFSTDAVAYGATLRGAGTITVRPALVIDVHGDRVSDLDPRRLPKAWGFLPLDASLNASAYAVRWTDRHWTVDSTLEPSTVEGAALAAGTTVKIASDPGVLRVAADGTVQHLDGRRMGVATGLTGLDDPRFAGALNGRFTISGTGPDLPNIDLTADADLVASTALVGADIASATVHYTRRSHANTVHVVGPVAHLNPASLGASAALASDLNGEADLTAAWRDDVADVTGSVSAEGTLRLGASTVAELPISAGAVTGAWSQGRFRIDRGLLENRGVRATATGWLAITQGQSSVLFEVAASDVGVLEPWTGRKATGSVTGTGTVTGAFDLPRVTAAFGGPLLADPQLGRYEHVVGTTDITFPEWYLDRLQGDIGFRAGVMTTSAGTRVESLNTRNHFTSRFAVDRSDVTASVSGVSVDATLRADWTAESTAWITAMTARRNGQAWTFASPDAPIRVSTSHLNATRATFANGAQRVVLDGGLAWSAIEAGGDPADHLTVSVTDVAVKDAETFLDLAIGATGTVTGQVSLDGRLSDPRGHVTVTGRDLSVRGYQIASLTADVGLERGAASVSVRARQPDGLALTMVGDAPLAWLLPAGSLDAEVPTPNWALAVVSDPINLDIFAAAAPLTQIGGQALADVRVTGPALAPVLIGTLAVADGRFRVPSAGVAFSNVFADIGLGNDTITVRRFTARDARDHALTVTGQLAVNERQVGHVDMHLDADRVLVVNNAIGQIELSSLLELQGDVSKPRLTGNIEVASGRVEVDRFLRVLQGDPLALVVETDLPEEGTTHVDLRAAVAAGDAPTTAATSAFDSRSFLSALAVDVRIFAPDNLLLRGSKLRPGGKNSWSIGDLNVTVGGDLQAQRAAGDDVRLRGDVTTVRGSYTFESRRFDLQRGGRIQFRGESPLDPAFDIRGVRSIDGVEARVDVKGRLSEPRLQLGSNMPLDEADVLSMIIFNRPVNQLGETQRADLVGAAASLAGGFVTAPLAQSLGRALDLDLLEVETVSFGQNVAPRVRVGQQITSRLFVQFSQQFGAQSVSELTAEYQLAKFLRLQGSTAQGPGSQAQRSLLQRTERVSFDLLFFFNY